MTVFQSLPSTDRLLEIVQASLQKLAPVVADQQAQAELRVIDSVLSELAFREDHEFHTEFYRTIRLLLQDWLLPLRPLLGAQVHDLIAGELDGPLPATLDPALRYDIAAGCIDRVMHHLGALVRAVGAHLSPENLVFLQKIVAEEDRFHSYRTQLSKARRWDAAGSVTKISALSLETYLRAREPGRIELRVKNFRQLIGGFQKVTVLFDIEDADGTCESLVLRMDKYDKIVDFDGADIGREFEIVQFVHAAGMKVAEPLWFEDDASIFGNRFFVSRKVPGESYGSSVSAKPINPDIARSHIEAIAKVHQIPTSDAMRRLAVSHWLDQPNAQAAEKANVFRWRNTPLTKIGNASPLMDRVVNWLENHLPQGDIPQCLIHCDFGPHNTLVQDDRLMAILDWESCRIGDPAEDLSFFIQSCAGQVSYQDAIQWYEAFTGHRISEFRLRYYAVFGCLKIIMSCIAAAALVETHADASILWLDITLNYATYATSTLEARIAAAEAVEMN